MLTIEPIPAFNDNYIWLLYDEATRHAFVVDPGDAAPVIERLDALQLELEGILITHHHFDHVGGLADLGERYKPTVFGPDNPAISGITDVVQAGESITVLGAPFEVMAVPGHTLDHIAYYSAGETPILFCGDTLFAGGCGRLFEGTPPMMLQSLQSLADLPGNTQVYCAHEYTLANLAFARAVEPDNFALQERIERAQRTRQRNEPTVPSDIALERATNPFLRCAQPDLHNALRTQGKITDEQSEVSVFTAVRSWKDNF
tara:strand:- start:72226 stop:73002 length:777 start_codon:yes stop_codon:yes gene_type:complete